MCGIAGIWSKDPSRFDPKTIREMTQTLVHRGPDGDGFYTEPKTGLALGHRRLKIIDLSENARQPMTNEDESLWITFNGEIYNFQPLKDELVSAGHIFKSHSDTEVLIHGYE